MTTTGFKNSVGVDIGTLFDPYVSGTQATATGYLDLSGNDLSTRFAPYVSGSQSATTGYTITSGSDLNTVFAPPAPAFPTLQSSVPNIGKYTHVYLDGSNMVVCCAGGLPTGDTYTYLYWSDNYASTLNIATINGSSTNKFFGCVAISGANAVAIGRLTSATGTIVCYVSSDYGKTYVSASGAVSSTSGTITMSGAVALRGGYNETVYRSTDYGNTWTSVALFGGIINMKIYGNNAYICSANYGLYYSTNAGLTFTRSTIIPSAIYSVTMVGTTLYIGGANVIYKSTNYGVNVTTVLSSANARNVNSITSCPATNGDFVWFGNEDTSINYYSNNSGSTWTTVAVGAAKPFLSWATATRMLTGATEGGGLYWGRNAYII
jgi:hypothetical protein